MSDPQSTETVATADAVSFLGTFALIFLTLAGLLVVDGFLARIDRVETRSEAHNFYLQGMRLAGQGRSREAADRFRSAVASERNNPQYERALAAALLSAGEAKDAEAVLADRLQRDPTDGAASLTMARALVREGKFRAAVSYYHRAIYGEWDTDAAGNRLKARFELVDLLASQHWEEDLLAELLPLQHEAPSDLATRRRIARLFTAAGSPSRAIQILKQVVRENSRDADAYVGLGEAELDRGNDGRAVRYLENAARLAPDNAGIAAQLAFANQILALDPTQRGLTLVEQYRRSRTLFDQVVFAADSCPGAKDTLSVQTRLSQVNARREPRTSAALQQATETNLQRAETVWDKMRQFCPSRLTSAQSPVVWVLDKISQ